MISNFDPFVICAVWFFRNIIFYSTGKFCNLTALYCFVIDKVNSRISAIFFKLLCFRVDKIITQIDTPAVKWFDDFCLIFVEYKDSINHAICHELKDTAVFYKSNSEPAHRLFLVRHYWWHHNGRGSVSNHQPHDCLLNRLFRRRSEITSKLRVTGLRAGNSPGTGEFPAQMASNTENVSIWWRHHEQMNITIDFFTIYEINPIGNRWIPLIKG